MRKTIQFSLSGVPWPVNLLRCSRQIDSMQPGDKLNIALSNKDIKDSLIQLLQAQADLSFSVSNAEPGYTINVIKRSGNFRRCRDLTVDI